ncbi:ATP-grasp domain-containing protein [Sphingomonas naphthae]|uniref:ATP-grasp domain-containing protein n=1 Tax=Sphingomonas naphthae TaxID=1813468 RepID=A0ABY7TF97_9SPHN|nr:ATP-grasp domain-containing protein [Sphingomonas naphthae]WCT71883.1 ATP-grasp domain-containing protein [Sphingomonas naphthae]
MAIAILYQALPPPVIDGLRKDAKPGGYSDSGADMGHALRAAGCTIVTPVADPDPTQIFDWVFPDTPEGIAAALAAGAELLWANTVLFAGHPIEAASRRAWIVGQDPAATQAMDDKAATNARLSEAGLPVATSTLVSLATLDGATLPVPAVVKPVRGRGSQGVSVVRDRPALDAAVRALIAGGRFGDTVMIEQFLPGTEITVTIMPPGTRDGDHRPWALPPVRRFDQIGDVAPYNGDVPVSRNSVAMTPAEMADPAITAVLDDCVTAATLLAIRAPIRIDCRQDEDGRYVLFDLNAKPNITGAGRPGRDDQDSLSTLAAQGAGWTYADLLRAALRAAWTKMDIPA